MSDKNLEELSVVLPCHSLEDFPVHHRGRQAEELLSAWTALWHPALIQAAGAMPTWHPAEMLPEDDRRRLVIIPEVSRELLDETWEAEARTRGAVILSAAPNRQEMVGQALKAAGVLPSVESGAAETDSITAAAGNSAAETDSSAAKPGSSAVGFGALDEDVVADFFALGFGYLQVELLTRHMRYTSHIDETYLDGQVTSAAAAAIEGDRETTEQHLSACFDALSETRDHFYPVDSYLIDITLVAPTTLGERFSQALNGATPGNLLLTGELVEVMARDEPDSLAQLRAALERETVTLVGGEFAEQPTVFQSHEQIRANLRRGAERYVRHLGRRPRVFGRFSAGLSATLPQVLQTMDYVGSLHFSFDGRTEPKTHQCTQQWEGVDGTTIPALFRRPLDAARSDGFLNLAQRLGESMDTDHVATLVFAHWPGETSPWFEDLRRVAARGTALGSFLTLDRYFEEAADYGYPVRFSQNKYQSRFLGRAIEPDAADPLARYSRRYRAEALRNAAQTARAFANIITVEGDDATEETDTANAANAADTAYQANTRDADSEEIVTRRRNELSSEEMELSSRTGKSLPDAVAAFAEACAATQRATPATGKLVVNPFGQARETRVNVSSTLADGKRGREVLVDTPALGYAWRDARELPESGDDPPVPLADEEQHTLRNEYLEVRIDSVTGAVRAIHDYAVRGPVASTQLAFRLGAPGGASDVAGADMAGEYSVMAADRVEVTRSDTVAGEITVSGRLLDREGGLLARYVQRACLARRSRVLEFELELDPALLPQGDPWQSYYALRLAWADELAEVCRDVAMQSLPAPDDRFFAPHFVDIRGPARVALLANGHAFHRRSGERMLDTLLIAGGEATRSFRLGVGVGLTHPLHDALSFALQAEQLTVDAACPIGGPRAWLFHTGCRNVVATAWEPLAANAGRPGCRVRLLETEGRSASVRLRCFRNPQAAHMTNSDGQPVEKLVIQDGVVQVELSRYAWTQVEVQW